MLECPACAFENDPAAETCELCGSPLQAQEMSGFAHPHRVPTGVGVKRPEELADHDTDVGLGSSGRPGSSPRIPQVGSITGLGEAAAEAAAEGVTRRLPALPADTGDHPVTDIGELAGESAVHHTAGDGSPSERLLGRVKLVVEQGRIIGEQYLLSEPEMTIGRADPAAKAYPDIDLGGQDNDYVHRVHARLQFHDLASRLSVEHLGGSNPTLVNNRPIESGELVELVPGDRLRVGRVVMRLLRVE